jgi:hypothetical protein
MWTVDTVERKISEPPSRIGSRSLTTPITVTLRPANMSSSPSGSCLRQNALASPSETTTDDTSSKANSRPRNTGMARVSKKPGEAVKTSTGWPTSGLPGGRTSTVVWSTLSMPSENATDRTPGSAPTLHDRVKLRHRFRQCCPVGEKERRDDDIPRLISRIRTQRAVLGPANSAPPPSNTMLMATCALTSRSSRRLLPAAPQGAPPFSDFVRSTFTDSRAGTIPARTPESKTMAAMNVKVRQSGGIGKSAARPANK